MKYEEPLQSSEPSDSMDGDAVHVDPSAGRRSLPSRDDSRRKAGTRTMTNLRGVTALATAALLLVAVTSCGKSGNDPAPGGSPSPRSSAPVTATTTPPPSDGEVASAAASALVRKYYGTLDAVRQPNGPPLSRLSSVATSVELSTLRTLVNGERAKGQHQTGATKITALDVQSVDLDNSNPAAGKVPTVQIDVCWNVTDVDFVDTNGHSIVSPSRPDTGWTRFTLTNYRYAADPKKGWRVATSQDLKRKPCAAS